MSISDNLNYILYRYIAAEVDTSVRLVTSWVQVHPVDCFGSEKCKCYETAKVKVEYEARDEKWALSTGTWFFDGTLAALIKMLDAYWEEVE